MDKPCTRCYGSGTEPDPLTAAWRHLTDVTAGFDEFVPEAAYGRFSDAFHEAAAAAGDAAARITALEKALAALRAPAEEG